MLINGINNNTKTKVKKMSLLVFLCCIGKCIIYGSSILFTGKLTESVDVLDVLALRFLMSFAVLWILKVTKILKIKVGVSELLGKSDRKQHIKTIICAAVFEPVLYMLFETLGISMTTNIMAGAILAISPIFSCVCESFILGEKSSWAKRIFLGIGVIGVLYITVHSGTSGNENSVQGIIFMFLAVISGCMFAAFSRKSTKAFAPVEITYVSCMLGTLSFNVINIIRHILNGNLTDYFNPYFNAGNMVGFVFLSVCSTIMATLMGNYSLKKMTPSSTAAFGGISTLVTVILGVAFNNEKIYMYHIIGFTLIFARIIGVICIDKKNERKR